MLRVLFVVPALSCAECEGDSCPTRGSVLLQASLAVVQQADMVLEEAGLKQERAGLMQGQADLTQEFLAKVSQLQEDSERDEADSELDAAEQEAALEEYVICHATGKSWGQTCQHWPTMGHIPAGQFPGWNGTHYCQEKKGSDKTCQVQCTKSPASCEEGGASYEVCRCEDLTAKTVAACEGKASGDKCIFKSEIFKFQCPSDTIYANGTSKYDKKPNTECKSVYRYQSMCRVRDGTQSCMPMRSSRCHTGFGKTLKWKPLGSPCVHATYTSSGRRRHTWRQNSPVLSYCAPSTIKSRPMLCKSGFNNKLSDETKAAMTASKLPEKMLEAASKMSETEVADILSFWGEA